MCFGFKFKMNGRQKRDQKAKTIPMQTKISEIISGNVASRTISTGTRIVSLGSLSTSNNVVNSSTRQTVARKKSIWQKWRNKPSKDSSKGNDSHNTHEISPNQMYEGSIVVASAIPCQNGQPANVNDVKLNSQEGSQSSCIKSPSAIIQSHSTEDNRNQFTNNYTTFQYSNSCGSLGNTGSGRNSYDNCVSNEYGHIHVPKQFSEVSCNCHASYQFQSLHNLSSGCEYQDNDFENMDNQFCYCSFQGVPDEPMVLNEDRPDIVIEHNGKCVINTFCLVSDNGEDYNIGGFDVKFFRSLVTDSEDNGKSVKLDFSTHGFFDPENFTADVDDNGNIFVIGAIYSTVPSKLWIHAPHCGNPEKILIENPKLSYYTIEIPY